MANSGSADKGAAPEVLRTGALPGHTPLLHPALQGDHLARFTLTAEDATVRRRKRKRKRTAAQPQNRVAQGSLLPVLPAIHLHPHPYYPLTSSATGPGAQSVLLRVSPSQGQEPGCGEQHC